MNEYNFTPESVTGDIPIRCSGTASYGHFGRTDIEPASGKTDHSVQLTEYIKEAV